MKTLQFKTYWNLKQKEMFKVLLDNGNWITDVWYWGWAWWGKSYWWVAWQWMLRNKYPWTRWFFWRKELKRLKQTTLATYFKFCDDYNIPKKQRGVYNAQNSEINFTNWSQILLLDLSYMPSDPLYTRFWSLELTDWFADEIAEIDNQCLMILKTRIWRQKNEDYNLLPKFLWTFNPDKWHVYRNYYKPFKEWNLLNYRVFIPALATDNKKLPKAYIEQLKKADEVTKQRLLYWNFDYDDTPWRLFDYNALLNMWGNIAINWTKYISCDVARKWKDQSIIWKWNWLELYEIKKESISNLSKLSDTIKLECQKDTIEIRNVIVDENWVWWWVIDNLLCQWFINNASPLQVGNKNVSNTRNYDMLKTQCYFKLAEYVNSWKIKISVTDEDFKEKLIEELDIIVEIWLNKDVKISILKKEDIIAKLWRSPDYADMLMMRMYYELYKIESINQQWQDKLVFNPYNNKMEKEKTLEEEIFWEDEEEVEIEFNDNPY